MGFRATISLCVLSAGVAGWGGCSPEEIQLETEPAALLEEGAGSVPSAGCGLVVLGGGRSGKVGFFAGASGTTHEWLDGQDDDPSVSIGLGGCSGAGEHELSVTLNGRAVVHEQVQVPNAKQSVVLVYAHTQREPRWSLSEVDLSPPGPGLRRARFTNYIEAVRPIEVLFYDASDQPVGESVSVAWGETWVGTLPIAAASYRLSPDQPVSTPFDQFENPPSLDAPMPVDLPCVEALPVGLVITHTYLELRTEPDDEEPVWRGTAHAEEQYSYVPPVCPEI